MKHFDLIVIGAGSGGLNIPGFMNRAGFSVLLIEASEENIGGDCLNTGCVPSKALIHIARTVKTSRDASRFGIRTEGAVDMKEVAGYIDSKKEHIRAHENKAYFESIGIKVVIGRARFASRQSVLVGNETYSAKRIVLATGSKPRPYTVPGIEAVDVLTNESIFDLQTLPERLLVVGGGPIGIELGQALGHLGSKVTFIVKEERILPREDEALAKVLQEKMEQEGITFHFAAEILRIEDGTTAVIKTSSGEERVVFDRMLVAIGRTLHTDGLDIEKAGIEPDERGGIRVNEYLETTNPKVLLCGDIVGQHQFTHAAELHAAVIIRNFFTPFFKKKLDTRSLSWVTYTTPELATFGQSEKALADAHVPYQVLEQSFEEDDRAIVDETTYGRVKLFVSPKGQLLGGSMVAPHAGELIQELILAQTAGLNISALFAKIYPYPTASRINKRAVSQAYVKKLTPLVRKVFKMLY